MDFTPFDARHYRTLPVRDGYREWAATYDNGVLDELDLRLLARLAAVDWARVGRAMDLACGTGRIGHETCSLEGPGSAGCRGEEGYAVSAGRRKAIAEPVTLLRNREGVEIATYSDDQGTPELHQRARVQETTVVEGGETRRVRRTDDTLERMRRNRTIDADQYRAGRRFASIFFTAQLSLSGPSLIDWVPGQHRQEPMAERVLNARLDAAAAIEALGGHGSPVAAAAQRTNAPSDYPALLGLDLAVT